MLSSAHVLFFLAAIACQVSAVPPFELFELSVTALPDNLPFCMEHGCFKIDINFDIVGQSVIDIGGDKFELEFEKKMGKDNIVYYNVCSKNLVCKRVCFNLVYLFFFSVRASTIRLALLQL
jgi:hypothetical protein